MENETFRDLERRLIAAEMRMRKVGNWREAFRLRELADLCYWLARRKEGTES